MKYEVYLESFSASEAAINNGGNFLVKKFQVVDEITNNTLSFVMGISPKAPADGDFSVSAVYRQKPGDKTGQPVFLFQTQPGRKMRANIVEHLSDTYIIYHDGRQIDSVFPISDLARGMFVPMKVGDKNIPRLVSGGMTLGERYKIKSDIAYKFSLDPIWTKGEYDLHEKELASRRQAEALERDKKRAEQEALQASNQEIKAKKVAALLKRPIVTAYTSDGASRYGIAIEEGDEDGLLTDNTFCILMKDGVPVQSYILRKKSNGRAVRVNKTPVFLDRNCSQILDINMVSQIDIDFEGSAHYEVPVFASFEAVEIMRTKHGLNSGTLIGVKGDKEEKEIKLYKVTKDKSNFVGHTVI